VNTDLAHSLEGAKRVALLYSLVQSCALIDVPPFDYLKDVLLRVAIHPHRLISELTPRGWAATAGHRAAAHVSQRVGRVELPQDGVRGTLLEV
jgi:hypothetical protein